MAPRRVVITGNTYPVKDELKALGATYDGKCWKVSASKAVEAQAIVARGPKPRVYTPPEYGPFRPNGPNSLCLACGDDCGGSTWECEYGFPLRSRSKSPAERAATGSPQGPCTKCGSYCEGDCTAQ